MVIFTIDYNCLIILIKQLNSWPEVQFFIRSSLCWQKGNKHICSLSGLSGEETPKVGEVCCLLLCSLHTAPTLITPLPSTSFLEMVWHYVVVRQALYMLVAPLRGWMWLLSESLPVGLIEKACLGLAVCPHLGDSLAWVWALVCTTLWPTLALSNEMGRVGPLFSHSADTQPVNLQNTRTFTHSLTHTHVR